MNLKQTILDKGWTLADVAARWGISLRRMQQICNEATTRHCDAVRGLPTREEAE